MDIEASSSPRKLVIVNGSNNAMGSKDQPHPVPVRVPDQPVQPTSSKASPDLSPVPDLPERKIRRNTTQSVSCPEPPPAFQDSPRATSQPMPPTVTRTQSPAATTQAKVEESKQPQPAVQPRSPPRSPSRSNRGGSRGRGFRGRYRGRGRGNSSKPRSVAQQGGTNASSIASSQRHPSSSGK